MMELLGIALAALLGRRLSADWGLALGIGLGLSSLTCWLTLGPWCLLLEVLALLCLKARPPQALATGRLPGWLWLFFAGSQILALSGLCYRMLEHPHGDWDAYAIWNCRARFLYRAGADWACAFQEPWSNPDYPLLLPMAVVRLWTLSGVQSQLAPQLIAASFWIATQLLLSGALWRAGRPGAALLAPCLLSLPGTLDQVAALYADVPLSFYTLAVPLLLGPQPLLAGVCAGLGAWTKNEGLLLVLWGALWLLRCRRPRQAGWFLLGCLPALATLLAFKLQLKLAALSWLGSSQPLAQLADSSRLATVLSEMLWRCAGGGGIASLHGLLWLGVAAAGLDRTRLQNETNRCCRFFLGATGLTYLFLYWITPYPLAWHLATSCDRLLLQIWPLSLAAALYLLDWCPQIDAGEATVV